MGVASRTTEITTLDTLLAAVGIDRRQVPEPQRMPVVETKAGDGNYRSVR